MTNVIYSIYIKNKDKNLNEKHTHTKNQLEKHYNRLVSVKKEYAKHCDADFIMFFDDSSYQNFRKEQKGYEFDIINLYKIKIWEDLAKKYDNVLYLDLDVIPNTTESFFKTFDMNKICVHAVNATIENVWSEKDIKNYKNEKIDFETAISHKDRYSMYVKSMCKRAMLAIDNNFDTDYLLANTAILGANSTTIKKLKFTEKINDLKKILNQAKKEEFFGEEISKLYFYNNEIFFHYLLDKYNIEWYNLPTEWHTMLFKKDQITSDLKSAKMIHLINKRFEKLWNVI